MHSRRAERDAHHHHQSNPTPVAVTSAMSVSGKWELCSISSNASWSEYQTNITSPMSTSITEARDFATHGICDTYLKDIFHRVCNNSYCPPKPVLLCVTEAADNNSTQANFLDERVCTHRASVCAGVADTLRANDHGSFDVLGHGGVIQGAIWFFAITALVGNFAVICRNLWLQAKRFKAMVKTERVHHLLVLNLALSDFLMGFYVAMFGIGHQYHHHAYTDEERYAWLASNNCLVMGVLSACSSQMSMTMLIIITTFRLTSVVWPFAGQDKRYSRAIAITLFSWLFWITYALIPLLSSKHVKNTFYDYVKIEPLSCFKQTDMHRDYLTDVMHKMNQFIRTECGEQAAAQYSLPDRPTWENLLEFGKKLKLFKPNDSPKYFGYYNKQSVCTAKYFIAYGSGPIFYTLAIVLFNCAAFIYISVAYAFMWKKTSRKTSLLQQITCSCCCETSSDQSATERTRRRDRENRKMQAQILIIIATNFLCWIPICTLSIYHFIKSSTYEDHGCEFHRYISEWSARLSVLTIVLLPINSSINPFIYSFRYWGIVKKQIVHSVRLSSRRMASSMHS